MATVALAVGAGLVAFSFANALWFKPHDAADLDRVVAIGRDFNLADGSRYSAAGIERLREMGVFEAVAGQAYLFGIVATDLKTYASVLAGLVACAMAAIALAGRRITTLSVADSLRRE